MSIIVGLGWVIAGIVATTALVTFWDNIRDWLNNVAADVVEKHFGYAARGKMQRALVKVDKVMDKVRNKSTIFVKKNRLDDHYYKTEIEAEAEEATIDQKVLDEIRKKGELTQEYKYNM